MRNPKIILCCLVAATATCCLYAGDWKPATERMKTRWANDVSPDNVWAEYPRPQLVRTDWQNMNGLWEYAITERESSQPAEFQGEILVPFAVESSLSGVALSVTPRQRLWYKRKFVVPSEWRGKRIILHFGAVDYKADVWVNNRKAGSNEGGFNTFSFDITDLVNKRGEQQIVVSVWDPTNTDSQARGKQVMEPSGIWYTPVTGIWQTVWLEPVAASHIESVLPVSNIDKGTVTVKTVVANPSKKSVVTVEVLDSKGNHLTTAKGAAGEEIELAVDNAVLWTTANPYLYKLKVSLSSGKELCDKVDSYFAMRKISVVKDDMGRSRIALNNRITFQYGTLDQGWWPDGLHTPPSPQAMRYDMEVLKDLGFNTLRKHIKVEPALYYYYADSLGLMIWQDMPSGFATAEREQAHVKSDAPRDWERPEQSAKQWEWELKTMIDNLRFFPSIVTWVVFNEGWGQYQTERVVDWVTKYDHTRLINGVSGWADRGVGDMYDIHNYPSTAMFPMANINGRVQVLGEFGGLGLPVEGHQWNPEMRNWGYVNMAGSATLLDNYSRLMFDLEQLVKAGLSAAIYTQTTDVEGEVNGLMSYDREVLKLPVRMARAMHSRLYSATPLAEKMLVADSRIVGNKKSVSFVDADGNVLPAKTLPMPLNNLDKGAVIVSEQEFTLDAIPEELSIHLYMNNKADIYINGVLASSFDQLRLTRSYNHYSLTDRIELLRTGKNTIRVEAHNNAERKGAFDYCLYAY